MVELAIYLAVLMLVAMGYALWEAGKLVWRFLVWATEPIRDEIAFQRMVREEREKEERLLAAHQEAMQEIDRVVAYCDLMHQQALTHPDDESRRRQSG